jgi:hypothetical protein
MTAFFVSCKHPHNVKYLGTKCLRLKIKLWKSGENETQTSQISAISEGCVWQNTLYAKRDLMVMRLKQDKSALLVKSVRQMSGIGAISEGRCTKVAKCCH